MKYLFQNIGFGLITCSTLFFASCEKNELEALKDVAPKVYISQVSEGKINLKPSNVIIDKANKVIKVPVGVNRSGNQAKDAYSVDLSASVNSLPAGTVPLSSDMLSGTRIDVPAGKSSGYVYLNIPKATLEANKGKKLAINIKIANATTYELNPELSSANVILDVNDFADKVVDVTSMYVKNAGNPFTRVDAGTRFGILADWTVNSSVKNMEGGTKGGFDSHNNGGWMSMERWGSPAIPNGKIYQTSELPAGKYQFEIVSFDGTPGYQVKDQAFVAVAEGNTLPDPANITTALAYGPFSAPRAQFTLDSKKDVTFGISANFMQDAQYFRIKQVKLVQFVNIFE